MNVVHRWYCSSDRWAGAIREKLVPWVLHGIDLGDDVLEIGPGPGITTDLLRSRAAGVTALEIDPWALIALRERFADTNVTVVQGDAARMPFEDGRFSAAICFTMFHHVPSVALQDSLLAEAHRVVRPGGLFAGSDSTSSLRFRLYHLFDTCVPVDPSGFGERLERAGFVDAKVSVGPRSFRFRATRP